MTACSSGGCKALDRKGRIMPSWRIYPKITSKMSPFFHFRVEPAPTMRLSLLPLKHLDWSVLPKNTTQRRSRRPMLEAGTHDPVYEALCIRHPCFLQPICMTKNAPTSVAYICVRVPWSASKVPPKVFATSLAAGNRQGTGHEVGWTNESSTQAALCWNNLTALFYPYSVIFFVLPVDWSCK